MLKKLSFVLFLIGIFVKYGFCNNSIPTSVSILKEDNSCIHFLVKYDQNYLNEKDNIQQLIKDSFIIWQDSIFVQPLFVRSIVPFTKNLSCSIISSKSIELNQDYFILQNEVIKDTSQNSGSDLSVQQNQNISISQLPPFPLVNIDSKSNYQGIDLQQVKIFPLQKSENAEKLRFYYEIEIEIKYDYSSSLIKFNTVQISHKVTKNLNNLILNKKSFDSFSKQSTQTINKSIVTKSTTHHSQVCNIVVSKKGWYQLKYFQLAFAEIPVESINPRNFRLYHKGIEVPILVRGEEDEKFDYDDTIEFWGEPNLNTDFPESPDIYYDPYSFESVYILIWERERGLRYGTHQGGVAPVQQEIARPLYFTNKIHIEEDNAYDRLGWAQAGTTIDHWFYSTRIGTGELRNFPIRLPTAFPFSLEPLKIKLWFHSLTFGSHRVEVYLNQQFIGTGEWQGVDKYLLELQIENIPEGIWTEGNKVLTIINRSPESLDLINFNWMEIEYPQSFEAENNMLIFSGGGEHSAEWSRFRLKGFLNPNIEIFKINEYKVFNPEITETVDTLGNKTYDVSFQDKSFSTEGQYFAFTEDKKLQPDTLFLVKTEENLLDPENQADYLIISHPSFLDNKALHEFIVFREQNYQVKLISTRDIYQQFNQGIPGPIGIKNFISFTQKSWKKPVPTYVLLVGDGNYLNRSPIWKQKNYVPVYHFQSYKWGATASDNWYVTDGENIFPNLNIGRWPVKNNQELEWIANKTITYSHESSDPFWQNQILMVAGNGNDFRFQTNNMVNNIIPSDFFVDRLYSSPVTDPFYGDNEKLITFWNSGATYLNFVGHGGGAVWADNLLFRFEDVERLNNGAKLPFITSMTCFTCAFDAPSDQSTSLAESLILFENGGAAAMFGASGLGWLWNDYYLLREILQVMFSSPESKIGEILSLGKIKYAQKYFMPQVSSMVNQYNLLGDPALVLKMPWEEIKPNVLTAEISPGMTLPISLDLPISAGQLQLEIRNDDGLSYLSLNEIITSSATQLSVELPSDLTPGKYWVKVMGSSENFTWIGHGSTPFQVSGKSIHNVEILPNFPTSSDSIFINAELLGFQPSDSTRVFFVFQKEQMDSVSMRFNDQKEVYEYIINPNTFFPGDAIRYYISILKGSEYINNDWQTLRIARKPEFSIIQNSLQLISQNGTLQISVDVRNQSDLVADQLVVDFLTNSGLDSNYISIGSDTIKFDSYQTTEASVNWPFSIGQYKVKVMIDSDNRFTESNELDNIIEQEIQTDHVQISSAMLDQTYLSGTYKDYFHYQIKLTPALVGNILQIMENDTIITPQQDLDLFKSANWSSPTISVKFLEELGETPVDAILDFIIDSLTFNILLADSQLALYNYYEIENRWAKVVNQELQTEYLRCHISNAGLFSFYYSNDKKPPQLSINATNRGFYDGGFVNANPVFSIRIEDANSAHPNINQFHLKLNDMEVNDEVIKLKKNYQNGTMLVQLDLDVDAGKNQLYVRGLDCSGNYSDPQILTFNVSSEMDLKVLGNYPNPFVEETVFCYDLSRSVEDFKLKIFANSGKLIRTISFEDIVDDPNVAEVGYHEIVWDGLDDDGNEVANGVYFYQYVTKLNGKIMEKVGKVARLQ